VSNREGEVKSRGECGSEEQISFMERLERQTMLKSNGPSKRGGLL